MIDIRDTETMQAMVEGFQQHLMLLSQYFALTGVKLDYRIVGQLRKEGLDSSGRLSFLLGTSAPRAAEQVTGPLFHAADALAEAAAALILAGQRWAQNVSEPIHNARHQTERVDEDYLTV